MASIWTRHAVTGCGGASGAGGRRTISSWCPSDVSVGSFLDLSFLPINLRKGDAMCIDGGLPGTAARGRLAVMSLPLCGELKKPPCQRCEEVVDPGLDLGVGALAAGRSGTRTSLNEALPSPLFLSAASIVNSKHRRARCAATL